MESSSRFFGPQNDILSLLTEINDEFELVKFEPAVIEENNDDIKKTSSFVTGLNLLAHA